MLSEIQPIADQAQAEARVVASSSAVKGLHDLALEVEADVIVVGSSRHGRLGRVLAGSVAERLFHGAPCAIAVAPRGFADGKPDRLARVGAGYDGGAEADLAVNEAAQLAARTGARLHVFAVAEFTPFGKGWNVGLDVVDVARRDFLEQKLEEVVAALPEAVHAEGLLLTGHPAEVLAAQGVDLLVVGSRGYGPLRTVLLGGVSGPLVRTARCPVVVLPRGTASERPAGEGHDSERQEVA